MSATTTHWLVIGQRVLGNHEGLWEFCRACEDLLGEGGMVIAEYALGNCIEPWNAFFQKEFDRKKWSRGRLFGAHGEIQWRTYGHWVRAAVLVDSSDEEQSQATADQLRGQNVEGVMAWELQATTSRLFLQTNDEEYTEAAVRSYGDEAEPAQFVRYCGVTTKADSA